MPNWKKVITSGSDASLNSLTVSTDTTIIGALTASGLLYPTTDGAFEFQVIQTDAAGTLSFGDVTTTYDTVYNGEATSIVKGTPLYISGSQGANPKVYRADAANPSKMPVIYIASEEITSASTGRGIMLGEIDGLNLTGYADGIGVYAAAGGGWTDTRPTGSNTIIQLLGVVTKGGSGGKGLVLNPGPATLPNIQTGYVWIGDSNSYPTPISTSSLLVTSASFATTASYVLNAVSASSVSGIGNLISNNVNDYILTSRGADTINGEANLTFNGSILNVTGSVIATSFTGSLLGTASYATQALSSSFATTASYVLQAVSASFAATSSTTAAVNGTINYIPRFVSSSILGNSVLIQSASNIGIGTTPQSGFLFDVNGQSALRGAVYVNGPLLEFGSTAYKLNNAGFSWINSGSGNLSIGTTVDSGFKLDVSGSTRLNGNTTVSGSIALSGSISLNNGTDLMKISRGSGALGRLIFSRPNNEAVESVSFGGGNEEIYIRSGSGKITHSGPEFQINNSTGATGLGLYTSAGDINLYGVSSTNGLRLFGTTRNVSIQNGGTFVDSGYRLDVSGSARIKGYANTSISSSLVVLGSGSSQPIFTVQGSQGELFSVTDSLSGSLFSVNDISGLPVLEAFSDNTVLLGSYQAPALLTTNKIVLTASGNFTLSSLPTASYDGAFYDYTARSGSNARAGSMMAIWSNGGTVNFTETTTLDFGSTSGLNLGVFISGSNMVLTGSASTTAWTIKTIIKSI